MNKNNYAQMSTNLWSVIMILFGIILIVTSKIISYITISWLLEYVGITIIGVFAVSFLYQTLIAKQHFVEFTQLLAGQLKEMDSIQSKCNKFGITELFETRNDYELHYPLMQIINECPEKGEIFCVARSLFHLLNKSGELKKGLENGAIFKLACTDPDKISTNLEKISGMSKSDVNVALEQLEKLLSWAGENKAKGSIELKYHDVDLLDSVFVFSQKDNHSKLIWDLSFGRDLTQKRVIIFNPEAPLGNDLMSRYRQIYNNAHLNTTARIKLKKTGS